MLATKGGRKRTHTVKTGNPRSIFYVREKDGRQDTRSSPRRLSSLAVMYGHKIRKGDRKEGKQYLHLYD